MTTQNDLNRTLGAWFHGDATLTPPPEGLARAIESTGTIRPRPALVAWIGSSRIHAGAWGYSGSPSFAAAALTILLAVAVSGISLYIGGRSVPTSTPSAPASPPSTGVIEFASTLYRYSVQVPGSWVVTAASSPWAGTSTLDTDATATDNFRAGPQTDAPAVSVKGQPLAPGVTAAAWLETWKGREGADAGGSCFGSGGPWSTATVDGVQAWAFKWRCASGQNHLANYDEYAFVVGAVAYVISGPPSMVDVLTASFHAS